MTSSEIYNAAQLIERIQQIGFLPLLDSGIRGFSAEEMVADDCRYVTFPDGGWDWPLWKWKGPVVTEGNCMYGKFFNKKAGFVSRTWWPDLCNYRRSQYPQPAPGTIEDVILTTLQEHGSLITRQLRTLCGFTAPKAPTNRMQKQDGMYSDGQEVGQPKVNMRSRFDAIITKLQMGCYIVTEDFVYPRDRHNHQYGWGWSLLTTPEQLYGQAASQCPRSPEESFQRMLTHLRTLLPNAEEKALRRMIQ